MVPYRILVIDDSEQIRDLLKLKLRKWGHTVLEACNGREGFDILLNEDVHFVITDWMMPDLNGLQLCRKIREHVSDRYVYIILLTARSALEDLALGMEAGADDFIAKPFHLSELQARISAGIRILELERQLLEKKTALNEAYTRIENDLNYAARLQRSLLPKPADVADKFQFESLFCPSRYLAGDIFNLVELDEKHSLVYVLDVAGKGVPAALLSFTLSKVISSYNALSSGFLGDAALTKPLAMVTRLNEMFHHKGDLNHLQYFTMIYAVINHEDRTFKLVQAGHPPPILVPVDGDPVFMGEGGCPVGLWPPSRAKFTEMERSFNSGDKLFLYSDGASEMFNEKREIFSEERLLECLQRYRDLDLVEALGRVKNDLVAWAGKDEFPDDLTLCALRFY